MGSICGGTFLLAQTGLLDGRRATTHLLCAPDLAMMYPAVDVDVDALIIDDDDMITVGGVMAWTDLGLVIVERLLGDDAMRETARFMMIDLPNRQQRFYSVFSPRREHGDLAISKAQHQVHRRANSRYKVADMAEWSGLEIRTFIRRFHAATGLRPNEYYQRMRIEDARKLLETTTETTAKVGWDVSYDDIASFRTLFSRLTGLTPSDHRKRFRYSNANPL